MSEKTGWEMETKLGDGMFEKVTKHDETLINHGERLDLLEENDRKYEERLKQVEDQSVKLENTVMSESRDTRTTMKEQGDRMFALVESSISYKQNTEKQDHEWRMQKLNTWSTVFLKISGGIVALLSAGGGVYYILQQIFGGGQ